MSVNLIWATPQADKLLAYMARVSNPKASPDESGERLVGYLIRKRHWSPFDMVNLCVEIKTSRDISRQVMRHWSLLFHDLKVQEFSQRYAKVTDLGKPVLRKARLQDPKNRQSSTETDDFDLQQWWTGTQDMVWGYATSAYQHALDKGVAKEQARAVLPEGITPTTFYLNGTARQWIHYLDLRLDPGTQKEHRDVAQGIYDVFKAWVPATAAAAAAEAGRRGQAAALCAEIDAMLSEYGEPYTHMMMEQFHLKFKQLKESLS